MLRALPAHNAGIRRLKLPKPVGGMMYEGLIMSLGAEAKETKRKTRLAEPTIAEPRLARPVRGCDF